MTEPYCPEADMRAAMTDGDFWAHVFPQPEHDLADAGDREALYLADLDPCPLCGSTVECGYDNEGRPMIHALPEDVDA